MRDNEGGNFMHNEADKVLWKRDSIGDFSVKLAYDFVSFDLSLVENLFYRHIWKLYIPKNVGEFIWRLSLDRLPTCDNLQQCRFASLVWSQCYSWLGIETAQHKEPQKHFFQHDCSCLGRKENKEWKSVWCVVV